jgi:hypothetical protein
MLEVQMLRGPNADVVAYTGPVGEIVINTTTWAIHVQDGATAGGHVLGSVTPPFLVPQGGTGLTSLPANAVLLGAGTGPIASSAPGAAHGVFGSNGATANPTFQTLSALLDAVFGSAQGDILIRGAAGWQALAAGPAGDFLQTHGSAANPTWALPPGAGTITAVNPGTGLSGGGASGAVTLGFANIANLDLLANTTGALGPPLPITVSNLFDATLGATRGQLMFRGAGGWVVLAPGIAGQMLQTGGTGADLAWAASGLTASVSWLVGQNPANAMLFRAAQARTIDSLTGVVTAANGAAATVSVLRYPAGSSSGAAVHSGSFNAAGAAYTDQPLTLTTTALAAGDRLVLSTTGTFGASAGGIQVNLH